VRAHAFSKQKEHTMTATTSPATRRVDGATLPVAGTWTIDPGHAEVGFVGRHFMITKVRGRFTDVTGTLRFADDPADSSVDVVIGMASVESGNATRDEHLRSAELFDVTAFPTATFRSTRVEWRGSRGTVQGDLTIHGVTRSVPLEVSYEGSARDPWGGERAVFSAATTIDREDYGITWNMALETGGILVSKEIRIEIEVETVLG
jgi:polyisoprenoid-binding protein YceI